MTGGEIQGSMVVLWIGTIRKPGHSMIMLSSYIVGKINGPRLMFYLVITVYDVSRREERGVISVV